MFKFGIYGEIGVDVAEQSKIMPSDKELVRQNILIFIAQVPSLLRYDSSSVQVVMCFLWKSDLIKQNVDSHFLLLLLTSDSSKTQVCEQGTVGGMH